MSIIYAVEGPSGSGKDYWFDEQKKQQPTIIAIERPVLPRCPDSWAGSWSSSFLEYSAIAAATMSQQNVLANRFALSRWVYRAMQFDNGVLRPQWRSEMANSFRRLKTLAVAEAWDRMGQAIYMHPYVELTVLLPNLHVLERQRSQTGKLYPFSGLKELELYTEIVDVLAAEPIPHIYVKVHRS
jgi:hypothetical protein